MADDVAGQAANLAKAMSKNADINKNFDVKVEGNSITLTSKIEGNNTTVAGDNTNPQTSTVTGVNFQTNKTAAQNATATSAGWGTSDAGNLKTSAKAVFKAAVSDAAGAGVEIKDGDIINLEFTLEGGKTLKVSAEAGKDFDVGDTDKATYDNLKDYLNNNATLTDDPNTVTDESKMKFGDLFTTSVTTDGTDNETSVVVEQKNTGFGELKLNTTNANATFTRIREGAADKTVANADADGTATVDGEGDATTPNSVYGIKLATGGANDAANLTIGDKMTFEGKLADGRTFSVTLEAGKDFKVGADYEKTLTDLKKVLESDSLKIQLSDGTEVKSSDIFGDDKEIAIDLATAQDGATFFKSVDIGAGASKITNAKLDAADASAISSKLNNGEQRTAAESTITFTEGVEYGAVVEVDGKKYEIVKAAGDVSNANHKAVVVDDISDTAGVAKALADTLKKDLNSANYTVTTSNNKVTVSSTKVGSTAQAVTASASGEKTTQLEFTLDPKKMQAGSTVTTPPRRSISALRCPTLARRPPLPWAVLWQRPRTARRTPASPWTRTAKSLCVVWWTARPTRSSPPTSSLTVARAA